MDTVSWPESDDSVLRRLAEEWLAEGRSDGWTKAISVMESA